MLPEKLTFTGHETFHCRNFWLKKGVDFLEDNGDFSEDEAVLKLGVGKNMVSSINYWLKVFGVNHDGNVSELANSMFSRGGWDEFLEYPGSLWIWQYHLVCLGKASIYQLFFKEFRKSRFQNQFQKSQILQFLERKTEGKVSSKTLENDIKVFVKMYLAEGGGSKAIEDDLSSLFVELNLITELPSSSKEKNYRLRVDQKKEIPSLVFLYCLLDAFEGQQSVSIEEIVDSLGDAFACTDEGVERHIGLLCEQFPKQIIFKEDAGRKEVQIKATLKKWDILEKYYNA